jgi:hypothetical protein
MIAVKDDARGGVQKAEMPVPHRADNRRLNVDAAHLLGVSRAGHNLLKVPVLRLRSNRHGKLFIVVSVRIFLCTDEHERTFGTAMNAFNCAARLSAHARRFVRTRLRSAATYVAGRTDEAAGIGDGRRSRCRLRRRALWDEQYDGDARTSKEQEDMGVHAIKGPGEVVADEHEICMLERVEGKLEERTSRPVEVHRTNVCRREELLKALRTSHWKMTTSAAPND